MVYNDTKNYFTNVEFTHNDETGVSKISLKFLPIFSMVIIWLFKFMGFPHRLLIMEQITLDMELQVQMLLFLHDSLSML